MESVGTGVALALAYGLVQVLKLAIGKLGNGKGAFQTDIQHLSEIIEKTDGNGTPLIYVPRTIFTQQKEILEELRAHGRKLEKISGHLEGIRNGGASRGMNS